MRGCAVEAASDSPSMVKARRSVLKDHLVGASNVIDERRRGARSLVVTPAGEEELAVSAEMAREKDEAGIGAETAPPLRPAVPGDRAGAHVPEAVGCARGNQRRVKECKLRGAGYACHGPRRVEMGIERR